MIRGRLESATWPPGWMARLLALACFGAGVAAGNCCPVAGPWYVLCFGGILSQNSFLEYFPGKTVQISLSISKRSILEPFRCIQTPNPASGNERPGNPGPGQSPDVLSSGFLPKKAGPPPGAGRTLGALRPKGTAEGHTRRVRPPAAQAPSQWLGGP